jgi:beta-phosphoglucomutase
MDNCNRYGVIWDMDGTLVDTAELHFQAWCRVAQELDKPFTRESFDATFGRRNPDIIHLLFQCDDRDVAAIGNRKEEYYRAAARRGIELLPGARTLLHDLQAAGFKQAMGSSAPKQNLDLIVQLTETTRFFDAVVSMEDTTSGKPDPQVFLVAAAKLGVAPLRCVVMEDAVAGVQAARAGGMKCIAVDFAGYHGPDALKRAGADLVVKSLADVSVPAVRALSHPRAGGVDQDKRIC